MSNSSSDDSDDSDFRVFDCGCQHCFLNGDTYMPTKGLDERVPLRAVDENDVEALQKWLDEHPRVKLSNRGFSVLRFAVGHNRIRCVKALLRHGGVDVNQWIESQHEPAEQLIHVAAGLKSERILKLLIDHGAYLGAAIDHRLVELNLYYIAARNRNEKVMELIIDAEVPDINNDVRFKVGVVEFNPLWAALEADNEAVVALLLDAGASVEKDVLSFTASHDLAMLHRLLAIDDSRFQEFSGAMCRAAAAARHGNLDILEFFLEKGANFDEPDHLGKTACGLAAMEGHFGYVDRLLRAGAKVPSCALARRHAESFERLVAAGADIVADFRSLCVVGDSYHDVAHFLQTALSGRMSRSTALKPVMCELCDLQALMTAAFDRDHRFVVRLLISMGTPVSSKNLPLCFLRHKPDTLRELFAIGVELKVCHNDWLRLTCGHLGHYESRAFQTDAVLTAFAAGVDPSQPTFSFRRPEHNFTVDQITQCQFELMRLRGLEICIGLQSLRMSALQLCEIMACMFAPVESWVPFHQVWAIATTVKHFKQQ